MNSIWGKRIPTLFGFLVISLGLVLTSFLVKNGTIFTSRATPTNTPENIRITNIDDTSFTVSFTTQENTIGTVSYGEAKSMGNIAVDDRDQKIENLRPNKFHYITIKDLKPEKKYFFSITSGADNFLNNGSPFETTTGASLSTLPKEKNPLLGKVLLTDGNPPLEGIVFVKTADSQTISTLVKKDGSYIVPLNSMRNKNLNEYFSFSDKDVLEMIVLGDSLTSSAKLLSDSSIVPTITLSSNYDFTLNESPIGTSSGVFGFPFLSTESIAGKEPKIVVPKEEEKFQDQQPLFKGVALPNEEVEVVIHSDDKIVQKLKADSFGNWNYRPDTPLSPGQHTITVTTKDKFGILKTLTQSFMVYAQGSTVSDSATPSATPIFATTPTPSPFNVSPTTIITFTPTPTLSPTPIATFTITPSVVKSNPTKEPGSSSFLFVTISGASMFSASIFLFLISRGRTSV
ncbi:MAG: Ig-like domain-containing protein [Patescibacteria group bacterium]|nr:Ig-like domain-containing protein [Patescibacteria group bacterium]